jgi:p-hydroxybenzoate 3-monooxygenase
MSPQVMGSIFTGFHALHPANLQRDFEKVYPFGWLGIHSQTPPLPDITY